MDHWYIKSNTDIFLATLQQVVELLLQNKINKNTLIKPQINCNINYNELNKYEIFSDIISKINICKAKSDEISNEINNLIKQISQKENKTRIKKFQEKSEKLAKEKDDEIKKLYEKFAKEKDDEIKKLSEKFAKEKEDEIKKLSEKFAKEKEDEIKNFSYKADNIKKKIQDEYDKFKQNIAKTVKKNSELSETTDKTVQENSTINKTVITTNKRTFSYAESKPEYIQEQNKKIKLESKYFDDKIIYNLLNDKPPFKTYEELELHYNLSSIALYSLTIIWRSIMKCEIYSHIWKYSGVDKDSIVWINFCYKIIKENIWWTYLDYRDTRLIKELNTEKTFYSLCQEYDIPKAVYLWYRNNPVCRFGKRCGLISREAHKYRFCHNCNKLDKPLE